MQSIINFWWAFSLVVDSSIGAHGSMSQLLRFHFRSVLLRIDTTDIVLYVERTSYSFSCISIKQSEQHWRFKYATWRDCDSQLQLSDCNSASSSASVKVSVSTPVRHNRSTPSNCGRGWGSYGVLFQLVTRVCPIDTLSKQLATTNRDTSDPWAAHLAHGDFLFRSSFVESVRLRWRRSFAWV